jgi:hypothetical protein
VIESGEIGGATPANRLPAWITWAISLLAFISMFVVGLMVNRVGDRLASLEETVKAIEISLAKESGQAAQLKSHEERIHALEIQLAEQKAREASK